ncbi:SOS response-associated peptidase [Novispirillum sp. DQ9]|uniref:SOS response-associated peptidase n=1 Tax=Novispirillum sp. DQ9 TaxID=3398612 RepID=UPI003C7DCA7A
MCSRFALNSPPQRLLARFGLTVPPPFPNAGVMRPTDMALVVLPGRTAALRPWGLRVEWSPQPVINARAETLRSKPTFRRLLDHRVIVPADSYTEWRTVAGAKVPHHISRADGEIMALAGLLDGVGRFTLITCAPAESVAFIHDRMPAILPDAAAESAWLDAAVPFEEVAGALASYPHPLRVEEERPRQGDLFG